MTCIHGCRRCERSRDIQTLTWVVVGSIIVGAAIQYWYISVPILGVVIVLFTWDKRDIVKSKLFPSQP